jgi:serine/threonine protein kinase
MHVVPEFHRSATASSDGRYSGATSGLRWRKGELLGRGAFGSVFLGLCEDTGALMAVKELTYAYDNKKEVRQLQEEINLMRCVSSLRWPPCSCVCVARLCTTVLVAATMDGVRFRCSCAPGR